MEIIKHGENVHEVRLVGREAEIALLSDLHWDNPKCDWDLLKRDLDYCKKHNIPIMINGDMFCLMQGRGDRRGNKSDIRPEHNNAKYLDSVVDTAIEWFSPYAHLFTVLGYGNHCTAIIKYQETDILKRFVSGLNTKNGTNVQIGGYGGWISWVLERSSTQIASFKHKYFHGSGGGGIVTKGAINLTRALETFEGFDFFSMGHIHENWCRNDVRDNIIHNGKSGIKMEHKQLHLMVTGAYKEEYGNGSKGWHIERGAPPKPVGGRIVKLTTMDKRVADVRQVFKHIDSYKFPMY